MHNDGHDFAIKHVAQCDAYVVNPFGNWNGLYIPNLFDCKPSKYHLD